ncbi:MAG: VWA domain-containing protein, partial [Planctomycetota bacterium]
TIPNKDFVLVYETSTDRIEDTVLAHTDKRGKFFTLVLQPPKRVRKQLIVPKEIVFVIDKSGSMRGFPIETAKQAMRLCIQGLHENDTFNLMTFEGGVGFCFDR